ncbi:hypothetical protein Hanom_Chr09g00824551 [Helianthus anomalus]
MDRSLPVLFHRKKGSESGRVVRFSALWIEPRSIECIRRHQFQEPTPDFAFPFLCYP